MTSIPKRPLGGNLILASLLALLSYVPFQWVAKGSLILCAILFIIDPIPPISRLLAIVSLFVIYGLTKLHNQHRLQEELEAEVIVSVDENKDTATATTVTATSDTTTDSINAKNTKID